jgi:hypothetical protein
MVSFWLNNQLTPTAMASKRQSRPLLLKTLNAPTVIVFIIWCLAIYAAFFVNQDSFWGNLQTKYGVLDKKGGLVLVMMPVLVLVLSGVVSSKVKEYLVFWKLKNALPGHGAFTKLAPNDPRIDMNELRNKLGDLPRAAKGQNTTWFKIYKMHESSPTVQHAHRLFLLARDLAVIALLFAFLGSVGLLAGGIGWRALLYLITMLIHYAILAIVAQNHAKRMVCNVLVAHLSQ